MHLDAIWMRANTEGPLEEMPERQTKSCKEIAEPLKRMSEGEECVWGRGWWRGDQVREGSQGGEGTKPRGLWVSGPPCAGGPWQALRLDLWAGGDVGRVSKHTGGLCCLRILGLVLCSPLSTCQTQALECRYPSDQILSVPHASIQHLLCARP